MKFSLYESDGVARCGEPVTLGMGVPPGVSVSPNATAISPEGCRYPVSCRVLSRRCDDSPRWILIQACLDADANEETHYTLSFDSDTNTGAQDLADQTRQQNRRKAKLQQCDRAITLAKIDPKLAAWIIKISIRSAGGKLWQLPLSIDETKSLPDEHANSDSVVRAERYETTLDGTSIRAEISLTYFVDSSMLRIDATLHNPNRAEHSGGLWDLGDPMSYCLESAVLSVQNDDSILDRVLWRTDRDQPAEQQSSLGRLQLAQHHSGGLHQRSHNHLQADGRLPPLGPSSQEVFTTDSVIRSSDENLVENDHEDRRFQPTVTLQNESSSVTATMLDFWEKFPSLIEADEQGFHFGLLARSNRGQQELQGGEKTTRTIWLTFGGDSQPDASATRTITYRVAKLAKSFGSSGTHRKSRRLPLRLKCSHDQLDWVHRPVTALQDSQELADSGSLEWFTASSEVENPKLQALFDELLESDSSFFNKREVIDEYGWRNFGDVWADHEEAYSRDPKPVISHYNNQYDLLHGFLRRYLQSGDRRWWDLARPLAEHVMDIDIYHTDQDRSAYNGGMFWHTSHYRDAGTCTHRTFSCRMTGDKHRVNGGGPSNEHNYTSGLLLYHHLTGCSRAAAAVRSLADWVIAMDDGNRSPLSPLSGCVTGYASSTSQNSFHGPGRGIANSINALLDAWTLTRSRLYLMKCEALIHRSIHPSQDFDAMELTHAELRWSYPVALQALLRFLHLASNQCHETSRYVLASLHHYGAWMQSSEKHFMDRPDELEFPTETWAAQDLRKGTTMMMIARYQSDSASSDALYRDGKAFFDRALDQLHAFPTRSCTRPAAILLQQVPVLMAAMESSVSQPVASLFNDDLNGPWPEPTAWEFQKADIRESVRSPVRLPRLVIRLAGLHRWPLAIAESALGKWWRTKFRKTSSL